MGAPKLINPGENAAAVTPSDDTDLSYVTRAVYVGGGGNLKVDMVGEGTGIIYYNLPAGTCLPIRVTRVYSTGTNATYIVGIY
jgi:hypothetical protein